MSDHNIVRPAGGRVVGTNEVAFIGIRLTDAQIQSTIEELRKVKASMSDMKAMIRTDT